MNHYVKELTQLFPRPLIHPSAPNNAMALSFLNSTKVRPLTHTSHAPHTHLTRPSHITHTSQLTIVASPSSPRYRLQSDSLAALGVGLKILLGMLSRHFAGSLPVFQATFTPPLPLNEYFEIIERHYRVSSPHCTHVHAQPPHYTLHTYSCPTPSLHTAHMFMPHPLTPHCAHVHAPPPHSS